MTDTIKTPTDAEIVALMGDPKYSTIEVADDEVLVALKRPEDYEDVAQELVVEDCFPECRSVYRILWPKEDA